MPRFTMPIDRWLVAALVSGALSFVCLGAMADELSDVQRLHGVGQTEAAMARADKFLATQPNDPQMRFLKGVMLADAGRNVEATAVFTKLTEDHPDLVEPYNNLAALYAAVGDYGKARATLEQALRANPGFATAHENLGDVYVALAGQSYSRAMQLAPNDPGIAPKLVLVRQVLRGKAEPSAVPALPAASASK